VRLDIIVVALLFTHRRRGVSELTGTLMTIGITLVAGTAVFGYVRTQANVSELAYGQNVGGTLNYLQERFVIPLVSYTSNSVTIYLYNNGQIADQFTQLEVYGPSRSAMDVVYDANYATVSNPVNCREQSPGGNLETPDLGAFPNSFSVKVNYVASITIKLPNCPGLTFLPGVTYFVKILGQYGNTAAYSQVM
jgi:flagellin-like protein